jgi:hypothetical protein
VPRLLSAAGARLNGERAASSNRVQRGQTPQNGVSSESPRPLAPRMPPAQRPAEASGATPEACLETRRSRAANSVPAPLASTPKSSCTLSVGRKLAQDSFLEAGQRSAFSSLSPHP